MKKILSILFVLCLILALGASLVACSHQCEFSAEWSKDETSHWRTCTEETCVAIVDKAEHTWDEGVITTSATQEAEGVRTFTCTVCSQTKTEAVEFMGVTKGVWNSAFKSEIFENFTYEEVATTSTSGISINVKSLYKFTKDNAWVEITMGAQTEGSFAPDAQTAIELRDQLIESIKKVATYENYKYDAETKTYKAIKDVYIESLDAFTKDITLTFADGKLVEMKYNVSFEQQDMDFAATSTITLSDYGTVVLDPSAQ